MRATSNTIETGENGLATSNYENFMFGAAVESYNMTAESLIDLLDGMRNDLL